MRSVLTGINPDRFSTVMGWDETQSRRRELLSEFKGRKVLIGVDDMDTFKGIDLKLRAFQQFLGRHPEWQKRVVLVQVGRGMQREKCAPPKKRSGPGRLFGRVCRLLLLWMWRNVCWLASRVSLDSHPSITCLAQDAALWCVGSSICWV